MMLDSVIKVNKKYYPQTLLEECKYEIKGNNEKNKLNDDLDLRLSDNETGSDSDNDESKKSDSDSDDDSDNDELDNDSGNKSSD